MASELAEYLAPARGCVFILTAIYQAYLNFRGTDFVTISSNNHASPTGALPFLLPASNSKNPGEALLPVPSNRIERWIREKSAGEEKTGKSSDENRRKTGQHTAADALTGQESSSRKSYDLRCEAYMSLLNHRIRNAYVCLISVSHLITE